MAKATGSNWGCISMVPIVRQAKMALNFSFNSQPQTKKQR